jgi:hypothetical protein
MNCGTWHAIGMVWARDVGRSGSRPGGFWQAAVHAGCMHVCGQPWPQPCKQQLHVSIARQWLWSVRGDCLLSWSGRWCALQRGLRWWLCAVRWWHLFAVGAASSAASLLPAARCGMHSLRAILAICLITIDFLRDETSDV